MGVDPSATFPAVPRTVSPWNPAKEADRVEARLRGYGTVLRETSADEIEVVLVGDDWHLAVTIGDSATDSGWCFHADGQGGSGGLDSLDTALSLVRGRRRLPTPPTAPNPLSVMACVVFAALVGVVVVGLLTGILH